MFVYLAMSPESGGLSYMFTLMAAGHTESQPLQNGGTNSTTCTRISRHTWCQFQLHFSSSSNLRNTRNKHEIVLCGLGPKSS